jgi:hypothetical protein
MRVDVYNTIERTATVEFNDVPKLKGTFFSEDTFMSFVDHFVNTDEDYYKIDTYC